MCRVRVRARTRRQSRGDADGYELSHKQCSGGGRQPAAGDAARAAGGGRLQLFTEFYVDIKLYGYSLVDDKPVIEARGRARRAAAAARGGGAPSRRYVTRPRDSAPRRPRRLGKQQCALTEYGIPSPAPDPRRARPAPAGNPGLNHRYSFLTPSTGPAGRTAHEREPASAHGDWPRVFVLANRVRCSGAHAEGPCGASRVPKRSRVSHPHNSYYAALEQWRSAAAAAVTLSRSIRSLLAVDTSARLVCAVSRRTTHGRRAPPAPPPPAPAPTPRRRRARLSRWGFFHCTTA
ncbi:hypothetical protein EVAR_75252_1 [Eumeta japonica]|uniref:Uncharacterized protein n=1 Tax=Eumeta variegata TaxID=151549 RepID=A0A4C1V8L7_EUMVA|nr:hypothetical protein EVAR_75252_1 [Eumeta japonica]